MVRGLRSRLAVWLLIGCATVFANGCTYLENRGADFADQFSIGFGVGLGGNIRATNYLQAGYSGTVISFRALGRNVLPLVGPSGEAGIFGAPIFHYRTMSSSEFHSESRLTMLGCTLVNPSEDSWHRWGDWTTWSALPDRQEFENRYDRRLWDIGFSAFLGPGMEFDINPLEIADFWLGWFGLDIVRDDVAGIEAVADGS